MPISGSIKARGGIYEVLKHAENLAIQHGMLSTESNYEILASERFKKFYNQYSIAVGSTGNLGLSIGIIGAKLGFNVIVHMSSDASEWKKSKLRSLNVTVIEYDNDYGKAVYEDRKAAALDPKCYFIDDENSLTLFTGYAVASIRLKEQLASMNIQVNKDKPLFVYLPCGVGGAPGGIIVGLKMALGDHVHCIFAEPSHSPSMLLGVMTKLHDQISIKDFGIDNITNADGLAVGRPSSFAGSTIEKLVDFFYTISDEHMFYFLGMLKNIQNLDLVPSAVAGMLGPILISNNKKYLEFHNFSEVQMNNANHIVWATGGGMVPKNELDKFIQKSGFSIKR